MNFNYCIDFPMPSDVIHAPSFLLRGWITVQNETTFEYVVLINDVNYKKISLDKVDREDVEHTFPGHSVFGFSKLISSLDIMPGRNYFLEFKTGQKIMKFPVSLNISAEFYNEFSALKNVKLERIREIICCPQCKNDDLISSGSRITCPVCHEIYNQEEFSFSFLNQQSMNQGKIIPTTNVSSNEYDPVALQIVEEYQGGLILDNGAGLRSRYLPQVVNYEVVNYPTTDVLGIGECLPFKSNSFDAVFSLAVLEHVKDPFKCAQEIERVLKPGGKIYIAVPFLQPFHGYPDHYYNMTMNGLKNLFSEQIGIIHSGVPKSGLPLWALTWFMNSYVNGLPQHIAKVFLNKKVADFLKDPLTLLEEDWVVHLKPETIGELACVNYLVGWKRSVDDHG